MSEEFTARAVVATEAAPRYAKQLASHLGRRLEVRPETEGDRLVFDEGSCLLVPGPDALELRASATSADALTQVQDVVGRHLERFGQRNELVVDWQPG
jgi:hypothetical protein